MSPQAPCQAAAHGVQCRVIIDATLPAADAERYIKVAYPPVDLAKYVGGA